MTRTHPGRPTPESPSSGRTATPAVSGTPGIPRRLPRADYERELLRLQGELVAIQEWVKSTGQRVVIIFEGRDAAGKGSTIKRIAEYLNPRVARIEALPVPTERERTQWYFQRYIQRLPASGEIVLFDRSWYNRAGVERVMGYCTPEEYRRFLHQCPMFERMLVEDGILLRKYWFSVSDEEQERRFRSRLEDPLRQWKFSPNDLLTREKWVEFSKAKDEMFVHTDIPEAPWYVVEADVKRHARLNMIAHLLSVLPYEHVHLPKIVLPPRPPAQDYERPPRELFNQVPDYVATLLTDGVGRSDRRGGKKSGKAGKSAGKDSAPDHADGSR
jgi:polyphosphate kinase 2